MNAVRALSVGKHDPPNFDQKLFFIEHKCPSPPILAWISACFAALFEELRLKLLGMYLNTSSDISNCMKWILLQKTRDLTGPCAFSKVD